MADRHTPAPVEPTRADWPPEEGDAILTTPEDVASAGRSCMAILVLGAAIVLLIVLWVIYRTLGGD